MIIECTKQEWLMLNSIFIEIYNVKTDYNSPVFKAQCIDEDGKTIFSFEGKFREEKDDF